MKPQEEQTYQTNKQRKKQIKTKIPEPKHSKNLDEEYNWPGESKDRQKDMCPSH